MAGSNSAAMDETSIFYRFLRGQWFAKAGRGSRPDSVAWPTEVVPSKIVILGLGEPDNECLRAQESLRGLC